jgi:hypothetical protein
MGASETVVDDEEIALELTTLASTGRATAFGIAIGQDQVRREAALADASPRRVADGEEPIWVACWLLANGNSPQPQAMIVASSYLDSTDTISSVSIVPRKLAADLQTCGVDWREEVPVAYHIPAELLERVHDRIAEQIRGNALARLDRQPEVVDDNLLLVAPGLSAEALILSREHQTGSCTVTRHARVTLYRFVGSPTPIGISVALTVERFPGSVDVGDSKL